MSRSKSVGQISVPAGERGLDSRAELIARAYNHLMGAIKAGLLFGFQLGTWFSVGMVGLAGAAILYAASNVLHHYPEDRYVAVSLALFASVAVLFWYVLRIFIASDD